MMTFTNINLQLTLVIELITLYSRRNFWLRNFCKRPYRLQQVPATI